MLFFINKLRQINAIACTNRKCGVLTFFQRKNLWVALNNL